MGVMFQILPQGTTGLSPGELIVYFHSAWSCAIGALTLFIFMAHGLVICQHRYCGNNTLDRHMVKGKIVLCDYYAGVGPVRAGAAGCIVIDDAFKDTAYSFPLPATVIGLQDGQDVAQYINISRYIFV